MPLQLVPNKGVNKQRTMFHELRGQLELSILPTKIPDSLDTFNSHFFFFQCPLNYSFKIELLLFIFSILHIKSLFLFYSFTFFYLLISSLLFTNKSRF